MMCVAVLAEGCAEPMRKRLSQVSWGLCSCREWSAVTPVLQDANAV
jgi:hypothetical protein